MTYLNRKMSLASFVIRKIYAYQIIFSFAGKKQKNFILNV